MLSDLKMVKVNLKEMAICNRKINTEHISLMFNVDERIVRKAISELGKEDWEYFYIPAKQKGIYKLARLSTNEEVNAFARTQLKSIQTIYFNKYRPMKEHISDQHLKDLMGQFEMIFIEEGEDENETI